MKRLLPGQARFIAKSFPQGRKTLWGVYDVALGSWPRERNGILVQQDMLDEATAQQEVDRVTDTLSVA